MKFNWICRNCGLNNKRDTERYKTHAKYPYRCSFCNRMRHITDREHANRSKQIPDKSNESDNRSIYEILESKLK